MSVSARPAPVSPDLDIRVWVLRADGTVLAAANPPSNTVDRDRAHGLSARVDVQLPRGSYYVAVTGVGHGGALTGYDGYSSVGSYTVSQRGCTGSA